MKRYCLGFDTSNYRTSCALYCCEDQSWRNTGELLDVDAGSLGLRQSDALFQHVRKLPALVDRLCRDMDGEIAAVGVSDRPRRVEGSYMPCFLAGVLAAHSAAAASQAPLYSFSHQEGHIASALFSAGALHWREQPFLSWHLSGGTTELLLVRPGGKAHMQAEIIGGTQDLAAGQIIDRCGVALGLPFPSGPHLEALALMSASADFARVRRRGLYFSLSGVENQFHALMDKGRAPADVARFALNTITQIVMQVTDAAEEQYGLPVLFSGGVSSSVFLRDMGAGVSSRRFAQHGLGGDNALGAALLAAAEGGLLCL